ncbi:hypothetical protein N431DRAFT_561813 [Stipitochalara longipes BDJ]|nr:hypothetical protein N431DRAFT_561813 [Stipitochalara longipes BDJ]
MPKAGQPLSPSEVVLVGNIPHKLPHSKKRERCFAPKVKTGCLTCRIRHVKCDEAKPACKRCTATGRKCDGYVSPKVLPEKETQNNAPKQLLPKRIHAGLSSRPVTANDRDIRQFDFFRNQTAQQLSGNFDAAFWNCVLLQFGNSEPTVWHSIVAVGSLHEQYMLNESNQNSGANLRLALDHYNKAIKRLTMTGMESQDSVQVILVSCLLFVCLELLLENVKAAMAHVHSGVSILEAWQLESRSSCAANSNASKSSLIEDHIVPIFHRLKIQVATFDSTHLARFSAKMTRNDWESELFSDLAHARDTLVEIWNAAMKLGETLASGRFGESLSDFTLSAMEQAKLVTRVKRWSEAFETLLVRPDMMSLGPQSPHSSALLRLQHKIAWVFISTALSPVYFTSPPPENVWDGHLHEFLSVVSLAESVCSGGNNPGRGASFRFEMGVIIPLYITALKCRDTNVRQRALAVLYTSPRREGFWDSRMAAKMAQRLIKLEEEGSAGSVGEMGLLDLPKRSRGEKLTYSQRVLKIQSASPFAEA